MLFVLIFLIAFVLLGGVVMFLSKTIDHGEARFDSETGKPIRDPDGPDPDARPATRLSDSETHSLDQTSHNETGENT